MARVLITGGTGLIGGGLARALKKRGDQVTALTRDVRRAPPELAKLATIEQWTPLTPGPWQKLVAEHDAVIHTVGERAVGRRYTEELKQRLHDSRVVSARLLVDAMRNAAGGGKPRTFVSASAVGYYGGHHGLEPLDETAPSGDDFLARLCVAWEKEAERAGEFGVRVVCARYGVVFGREARALKLMALPFRLFGGGPIGDGSQVVSWVHIEDAIGMTLYCLDDKSISGPVNITSPQAATNEELSVALGAVLGRPSWLRVPKFALDLVFGEGAETIVGGQRAVPKRLSDKGYRFSHPDLRHALEDALL